MKWKGLHGKASNELGENDIQVQELLRRIKILEANEEKLEAEIARLNALLLQHQNEKQDTVSSQQSKLADLVRAKSKALGEMAALQKERDSLKDQHQAKNSEAEEFEKLLAKLKAELAKAEKDKLETEERARQQQ